MAARVDDPDDFRMSLGEHLEELRSRLIRVLVGFVVALVLCLLLVRDHVMPFFARPLLEALRDAEMNPQLYSTNPGDVFTLYLQVSMIAAAVIASPWGLWQLWQFVATGLYPHERRVVTRFIPLSLVLLVAGISFAFTVVVPLTLQFFLGFAASVPLPEDFAPLPTTAPATLMTVPSLAGDPAQPVESQIWFNQQQQRLKFFSGGRVRVLPFGPGNLVAPLITIPEYIGLVFMMLLLFGLSFQLPIVVTVLARLGVFDIVELRKMRKIVYFALIVAAAVVTPGDVLLATVLLVIPLIGLYELGLLLAGRGLSR